MSDRDFNNSIVRRECIDLQDPYCAWDGSHCVNHLEIKSSSKQYFVQTIGLTQNNVCPKGMYCNNIIYQDNNNNLQYNYIKIIYL